MSKNTGGAAFARPANISPGGMVEVRGQQGMTLRAYIATKCCAAMVSTIRDDRDYDRMRAVAQGHDLETVSAFFAQESVKQADALIAALEAS